MSSSLFLTNWLFCGIAAWILASLLQSPHALTNKNKYPILFLLSLTVFKLFIPFEFFFTTTIPISFLLTYTRIKEQYLLFNMISLKAILILLWMMVSLTLIISFIYKHLCLKRLLAHFPPTSNKLILKIIKKLCKEENIKRVPTVIQINSLSSPFVFGFFNPTIVLPKNIKEEQIKIVLLHELQHIKHGHLYIKLLANLVLLLHWWFPIVWYLNTKLMQALEYQVDYNVSKKLSRIEGINYMQSLIEFAKLGHPHYNLISPLSFADNQKMLKNRLSAIQNFIRKRSKLGLDYLQRIAILGSFLLLLFPFFYTFEASYNPSPEELDGAFSITSENSYFVKKESGGYSLYVNGDYVDSFNQIPDSFYNIEVRNSN